MNEGNCKNIKCAYHDKKFEQNCCAMIKDESPIAPFCHIFVDKPDDIIGELVKNAKKYDDYFECVDKIVEIFPKELEEQLFQLVNGPVSDGNIISKTDRSRLFRMGIAISVCCKGGDGYTGAKNIGYSILKKLKNNYG